MTDNERRRSAFSKIDLVVEAIAQSIIRGGHQEGGFLPSEGELGKQYGVSRSVIRETIRRLGAAGMVETRHGIGSYVNPATEWNLFDPLVLRSYVDSGHFPDISRELVELRAVVEIESARRAAQQASPNHLRSLQQWLDQMEIAIDDLEIFARADVAYHNVIITSTDNRFLIQIMKYLTDPIIETRRITTVLGGPEGRREAQRWHRELYQAISTRNPPAAAEAMRQHMEQLDGIINRAYLLLRSTGDGEGSNHKISSHKVKL